MYQGFEPVFFNDSRILILGSFPSVKSREVQFYYGNKNNRFWGLLSEFFNEHAGDTAEEKIKFLKKHKIALWDIVMSCEIEGSKDEKISDYTVAELEIVTNVAPVQKIICNGKKSYDIFARHYGGLSLPSVCLPSTSPRNFYFDKQKWFKELSLLK